MSTALLYTQWLELITVHGVFQVTYCLRRDAIDPTMLAVQLLSTPMILGALQQKISLFFAFEAPLLSMAGPAKMHPGLDTPMPISTKASSEFRFLEVLHFLYTSRM